MELAFALLGQIWPARGQSFTEPAGVLVNRGLATSDSDVQWLAASILRENGDLLASPDGYCFRPACVELHWPTEMPQYVREALLDANIRTLAARDLRDWKKDSLSGILVSLEIARVSDPAVHIRAALVLVIATMLRAIHYETGYRLFVPEDALERLGREHFYVDEVRQSIEELLPDAEIECADTTRQEIDDLRQRWGVFGQEQPPQQ
jgi:hypothetical protein